MVLAGITFAYPKWEGARGVGVFYKHIMPVVNIRLNPLEFNLLDQCFSKFSFERNEQKSTWDKSRKYLLWHGSSIIWTYRKQEAKLGLYDWLVCLVPLLKHCTSNPLWPLDHNRSNSSGISLMSSGPNILHVITRLASGPVEIQCKYFDFRAYLEISFRDFRPNTNSNKNILLRRYKLSQLLMTVHGNNSSCFWTTLDINRLV